MNARFRTELDDLYVCDLADAYASKNSWAGDDEFDVLLVIFRESLVRGDAVKDLVGQLVLGKTDWFDALGPDSEWLHDLIDRESVRLGRQERVGDGSPMTAWFEDMRTHAEMADHVFGGGLGGNEKKLVVILGSAEDFNQFIAELKNVKPD